MSQHHIWYDWLGLNSQIFLIINGFHASTADTFMLGVTALGHPSLYPFYIAITLLWNRARPAALPLKNVVVFALSFVLVSVLVVPALKSVFDFPRPVQVLGETVVKLVGTPDSNHSFPSGHAAFAVLTAASLFPHVARGVKLGLVTFALLVCVSRIWVGAHYPADVLAGCLIAMAVVNIVSRLVMKEGPRI